MACLSLSELHVAIIALCSLRPLERPSAALLPPPRGHAQHVVGTMTPLPELCCGRMPVLVLKVKTQIEGAQTW